MRLFDMHMHLPSESAPQWSAWSTDGTLARLDDLGVDRAVLMTFDGFFLDSRRANDIVAESCADSGGRLVPLGTVDPNLPTAAEEVRRCASDLGMRAIKLHPWLQGFSPVDRGIQPVAREAAELGIPLVLHDGTPPYSSPLQIANLAERHPDLTVVLAHGGLFDLWQDAAVAVNRHPNVHVTLCGTAPPAVFRRLFDAVDWRKVSLGTDNGFGDPELARHRIAVHRLLLDTLEDEVAEAVSFGNAARLLGVDP